MNPGCLVPEGSPTILCSPSVGQPLPVGRPATARGHHTPPWGPGGQPSPGLDPSDNNVLYLDGPENSLERKVLSPPSPGRTLLSRLDSQPVEW